MPRADWTRRALAELDHQIGWIAARDPAAAERFRREVARAARLICDQPGLGFRQPRRDVRVYLTRRHRYRIVYRPEEDGVTILRFLHPSQDF